MRRAIALVVLALMLTGCEGQSEVRPQGLLRYQFRRIEGMPCILVGYADHSGITCDWGKWTPERIKE